MTEIFGKLHRSSNSENTNQASPSTIQSHSTQPVLSNDHSTKVNDYEGKEGASSNGYDPVFMPDRMKMRYNEITAQLHKEQSLKEDKESGSNSSESNGITPMGTYSEKPKLLQSRTPPSSCYIRHDTVVPKDKNGQHAFGRLYVRLHQGRDLNVKSVNAQPYAVITFEKTQVMVPPPFKDIDGGIPISIPSKNRPLAGSASGSSSGLHSELMLADVRCPHWDFETVFDVTKMKSQMVVSVYDKYEDDKFLGSVKITPIFLHEYVQEAWYKLEPLDLTKSLEGEIKVETIYEHIEHVRYGPEDFTALRLIGKGTFGQVYLVRKNDTNRIYAMKKISKKLIVRKKEVTHTLGERNILVRTSLDESPFIVGLKFSFQTASDLYLITDYMSGGELFWHLQHEGRFPEQRAKFYIAELVLALEHLHKHDIIYRDLKPENILLDADGHIALCDFGLSKANLSANATTNTFCGTTEYLAPEVLLEDKGYTKQVDFWSLGVLVFEMCCGWSPFYAPDVQQMYRNIAFGKVRFPKGVLSSEGRSFVRGLLNRNPNHRLGAVADTTELKEHPFFADINWDLLSKKKVQPPFKPNVQNDLDVSNFDKEFTNTNVKNINIVSNVDPANASTPLSNTIQDRFRDFTFVNKSIDEQFQNLGLQENEETDNLHACRTTTHSSVNSINSHGNPRTVDANDPVADTVFGETFEA